jgi:hypothetical protein
MSLVVNRSMTRSIIGQLPKQGGGQLPPFKGALTARHPRPRKSTCNRSTPMHGACCHYTITPTQNEGSNMNSEPVYVVIAIAGGDGCERGSRVWSERFKTRHAADRARSFLKQNHIDVWVIEDHLPPSA